MLDPREEMIARRIIEETDDASLAVNAIILRRIFPQLAMKPIDLAAHFIHADREITELDAEIQREGTKTVKVTEGPIS